MTLYKLVQDVCNLGKAEPNISFETQADYVNWLAGSVQVASS